MLLWLFTPCPSPNTTVPDPAVALSYNVIEQAADDWVMLAAYNKQGAAHTTVVPTASCPEDVVGSVIISLFFLYSSGLKASVAVG